MQQLDEKILIVDDDADLNKTLVEILQGSGYQCVFTTRSKEAMALLQENRCFVVLTDYLMPEMTGLELAEAIRAVKPLLPIVMITGFGERELLLNAMRTGVTDFLDKPFEVETLLQKIAAIAKARMEEIARDSEELRELTRVFVEESRSILSDLDPLITELDGGVVTTDELNVIYRKVHTLKGSAGSVPGAQSLVRLAHSFETVLSALKEQKIELQPEMLTVMLASLEILGICVASIEQGVELPDTSALQKSLDAFASGSSPTKVTTQAGVTAVEKPKEAGVAATPKKAESGEDGVFVPNERLETLKDMAGELVAFKNTFDVFLKQHAEEFGVHIRELMEMNRTLFKITDHIQEEISDVQQVSFGKTFAKFPRVVRQVAGELGKQIKLTIVGSEMTVDRTVSRALSDALIHAVRNSCDHGVESPEKRTASGKPAGGNITIRGSQSADTITVEVNDDGAGLNRERIAQKAIERGFMTEEQVKAAGDAEIWDLLFLPNFSTAEKVSDISGRGVGMDVVKTAAKKLGGTAWFDTQKGKSTTLTLQFPVPKSLVVESSVIAESGDLTLVVPLSSISEIRHVDSEDMTYVAPFWTFQNRGVTVPVGHYQFILDEEGMPLAQRQAASVKRSGLVAVLHHRGRSVGVYLDTIVDQLEAVIRPFDDVIGRISGFRGVSRLPNDGVAYVVSAEDAVANVFSSSATSRAAQ